MIKGRFVAGALFLFIFPCVWAQDSLPLTERLTTLLDTRFKETKCPGLSVAVALHNQIIFSKALGMADLEQSVPMATVSVQRLASLSKPVTGTIIMGLVEQGKLQLDVPIRQYLPELPEAYQKVTLMILRVPIV